jgi:hypothetical protein
MAFPQYKKFLYLRLRVQQSMIYSFLDLIKKGDFGEWKMENE